MLAIVVLVGSVFWLPVARAWWDETLAVEAPARNKPSAVEVPTRDGETPGADGQPSGGQPSGSDGDVAKREGAGTGPVLSEPGEVPASGPGSFVGEPSGGPLLGGSTTGRLKRFRVAVESNLVAELAALTAAVDAALGDHRSWIAGGTYRFQRVPYTADFDFTIYLVTRGTAYPMCAVNGVDIRVDGVPYTSCRQVGKVIINLDRWRLSVPSYVGNAIPLAQYRTYVINHEVGHELGHQHVGCPGAGQPAPVMLTQTLGLQGCTANPWPYPAGAGR